VFLKRFKPILTTYILLLSPSINTLVILLPLTLTSSFIKIIGVLVPLSFPLNRRLTSPYLALNSLLILYLRDITSLAAAKQSAYSPTMNYRPRNNAAIVCHVPFNDQKSHHKQSDLCNAVGKPRARACAGCIKNIANADDTLEPGRGSMTHIEVFS
jgi:hypothetical protein